MRKQLNPTRNNEGYIDLTAYEATKNAERELRGRRSRISGQHFEDMIAASLNWYKSMNVAHIEKTPEPMKPLGKANRFGQFLACFTKQGQPDFKGTITGGRSVVFEAKHTDGDRITFDRLTAEQVRALDAHHKLGAATFVLVSFGLQDFYRVPWETWRDMKELYGRKYIRQNELEECRVQFMSGVLKLLEGIETVYGEEDPDGNQTRGENKKREKNEFQTGI